MIMLAFIPFLTLVLLFLNVSSWKLTSKLIFREKIIASLVLWFLIFALLTEILSPFYLINVLGISTSWILISLILLMALFFCKPKIKDLITIITVPLDKLSVVLLVSIGIILSVTFILAVFVSPNGIDTITYQLARIPHWIQNQSVDYYATHFSAQIYLAPFASYPKLHFQLLSGGDWFANLVQWISMVGSIIGISLLTKYFGGNLRTQILTIFIAATIPMGIMQATSNQDDYVLSLFLVSFVYFALHFNSWKKDQLTLFVSGISLGLAFFTKQTGYIYSLPFLFWFLWMWNFKFGLKKAFYYFIILCTLAIIVNLGFYYRNLSFVGWPLFSLRDDYFNDPVGLRSLVSGVLKNIALNLSTPFPFLNHELYLLVKKTHNLIHIPIDNYGFNWPYTFGIPHFEAVEYYAPNTSHILMLFISAIFFLKNSVKKKLKITYLVACITGFILFSTIIRWQPTFSRLHLPLFVLLSPILSLAIINFRLWIKSIIITLLILSSFYFLFFNQGKPLISSKPIFLVSREKQYFINWSPATNLYEPYQEIGKIVQKNRYKKIGLIYDQHSYNYEYPLWVILKKINKNIIIEHIEVSNPTKRFADKNFMPDCVVFLSGNRNILKKYITKGITVIGLN